MHTLPANLDPMTAITWVITFLTGLAGIPILTWLKKTLHWDDTRALVLTAGISALMALLVQWLNGFFVTTPLNFEHFAEIFKAVMLTAMVFFKLFQYGSETKLLGKLADLFVK